MLFRISAGKCRKRKGVILVKPNGAASVTRLHKCFPGMEEHDIKQDQAGIPTRDKFMCVARIL